MGCNDMFTFNNNTHGLGTFLYFSALRGRYLLGKILFRNERKCFAIKALIA